MKKLLLLAIGFLMMACSHSGENTFRLTDLPERPLHATSGSTFSGQVSNLDLYERELAIYKRILAGNVPSFLLNLYPVSVQDTLDGRYYSLTFFVTCDYLAVGSEQDYFYTPVTPGTAQRLADTLDYLLPTSKMVDLIYEAAGVKLRPQPIAPSDTMTTVPIFLQHTDSIRNQFSKRGLERSKNTLVAGHKKDIIISNEIYSHDRSFDRVVIYGWHKAVGDPIQPVYNGHGSLYADYSHGVRLVHQQALLNGKTVRISDVLKDPRLSCLVSSEGTIPQPFYPCTAGKSSY